MLPWTHREGAARTMTVAEEYLKQVAAEARRYRALAERAIAQVGDADLHRAPDPESNSIAVIMQHVGGNLHSRWTEFLASDGEKPDRDRDGEFVDRGMDRAALLRLWDDGWQRLLSTLGALTEPDLGRTVTIRGEPHTVIGAIERAVTHCSYHCGQIVFLAKSLRGGEWESLSIARGGSRAYNDRVHLGG